MGRITSFCVFDRKKEGSSDEKKKFGLSFPFNHFALVNFSLFLPSLTQSRKGHLSGSLKRETRYGPLLL
ncbi:MAG: hypothetical protein DRN95_08305 [Candidatus Hydrothermarchaeota archaeon]|nr:MAG: hypothetical protein DRN95_08305 [Candidatus Hydrothermarchaeota archaeon]